MTLPKLPLLLAAACDDAGADPAAAPPSSAVGPGISIADALASGLDGPLLVNGFLVVQGDAVRLCEAIAESFPPQCGVDSLRVGGLDIDLDAFEGLSTEQDTTWSEGPVQLLGEVEDDVLTIATGVSG